MPKTGMQLTDENVTQWHSRLGTAIRSSSLHVDRCQTRMLPVLAVAKTSLYSYGNARSLIFSLCADWMSSCVNLHSRDHLGKQMQLVAKDCVFLKRMDA